MNYKILLFDLDDTLLDFTANEMASLTNLFEIHGVTFTDEIFKVYSTVNRKLWDAYENSEIPLDTVLNTRFSETLSILGYTVDGIEWEGEYRKFLSEGYQMMEGALEVCKQLSQNHRLFIVTNGVTTTQINRLKLSGLYDYFEGIYTSQEIGFQKPAKEFFDYVIGQINDFNKTDTLIIGDSLSTDIKGGNLAGIHTCWMNPESKTCPDHFTCDYTISNLHELLSL
jgi:2-haloacid dehalogenase